MSSNLLPLTDSCQATSHLSLSILWYSCLLLSCRGAGSPAALVQFVEITMEYVGDFGINKIGIMDLHQQTGHHHFASSCLSRKLQSTSWNLEESIYYTSRIETEWHKFNREDTVTGICVVSLRETLFPR